MARVEADAEAGMSVERIEENRELVDRAADRPARAGGVLEQQPGRVRATVENLPQGRDAPLDAGLEPRAKMRADVEDDTVRPDRARSIDGGTHRRAALAVDRPVLG